MHRFVTAMRIARWMRDNWPLVLAANVGLYLFLYGSLRLVGERLVPRIQAAGRLRSLFALGRLYTYALPYQGLLFLCIGAMASYSFLFMGRLALVRPLFDQVFLTQLDRQSAQEPVARQMERDYRWHELKWLAFVFLGISVPLALLNYLQEYLQKYMMVRTTTEIRKDVCRHLLGLSIRFFHERKAGDVISRVTNDVSVVQGAVTVMFGDIFLDPLMALAGIGIAAWYSWQLAIGLFVLLPMIAWPVYVLGRRMKTSKRKTLDRLGEMTEAMHQMFGGIRVVKSFRLESKMMADFDLRCRDFVRKHMSLVRAKALSSGFMDLVSSLGIVLLVLGGGYLVVHHRWGLTGGAFAGFILAFVAVNRQLTAMTKTFNILQESVAASERIFELLETQPEVEDAEDALECPPFDWGIELKGVSFAYRDEPVLKDVSAVIRAGEIVALVGPTGAGKSTLLDLVARYYDPTEGAIELDGCDLTRVRRGSLLSRIAIVAQDTFLFHTTIEENIRYGRAEATQEEVREAARAANIDEFIMSLPEGYGSVVGERGAKLSGGQRQRIAIARAVLRNPRILLLDEATSALDSESEQAVQAALQKLMEGRTVLVIAHRLSTVQHAHRILVLERGKIVESGSHDELMARAGLYQKLYTLQFRDTGTRIYRPSTRVLANDAPEAEEEM